MSDIRRIIGNDDLRARLADSVESGRISHAYIFSGPTGIGKEPTARWFSAALLCQNSDRGTPCGSCPSCLKMESGSHPDYVVISGEGASGSVRVDAVRALVADSYVMPNDGDRKVYIIKDGDRMTVEAQNALLKVFEEPPVGVTIIVLAANAESLLPTIRSRAMICPLTPLGDDEMASYLSTSYSDGSFTGSADAAFGIPGKAEKYREDDEMPDRIVTVVSILHYLCREDLYTYLKSGKPLTSGKEELEAHLDMMALLLRDIAACGSGAPPALGGYAGDTAALRASLTNENITNIIEILDRCRDMLAANIQARFAATDMLIQCWEEIHW